MAYDFPANPVAGQEFIPPMGGQTYVWYSPRWLVKGAPPAGGGAGVGVGIEEAPINANQYGRSNGAWTIVTPNPVWSTLSGKPATFPADPHVHTQADVTGLTAALTAKEAFVPLGTTSQFWRGDKTWQPIPPQDWTTIANRPSTFTPAAHIHPQSEITNLVADLGGKAALSHVHAQADVTGLVAALAGKEGVVTGGTTTQFWRGDKTWQSVPAGDWSALTGKPASFPPSAHVHAISDVTSLQAALDAKSTIGHTHDYLTLINIPTTFIPSAHIHSINDITDLVATLATKAPLASPIFTGTVTLPITNVTGTLTGLGATFSGAVEAGVTLQAKAAATGNVHLWLRGPANEDRMVLYTSGATLGNTNLRVGGTQYFTFSPSGVFTAPGAIQTAQVMASGTLTVDGSADIGGSLNVNGSITSAAGHVISKNYVYAQAGYFIGASTLVVVGTPTNSVGDVALRPCGYNTSANQAVVDGATGSFTTVGHMFSNTARFIGSTGGIVLASRASGGICYLRPNGEASGTGQTTVSSAGDLQVYRNIDANGSITCSQNILSSTGPLVLYSGTATGTIYLRPNKDTTTEQAYYQYNGNFVIGNQGYKAVAGSWAAASDGRIKTVVGDYIAGLKEILQLKVRRYIYKGNETQLAPPEEMDGPGPYEDSPHRAQAKSREVHVSLIAQEAEAVMPDLVTRSTAWIDGIKVDDFRTLNPTNITWALINAVQEMAEQIQTLKGELHALATGTRRTEYPRLAG